MILTKFLRYASEKRQAGHTETPEAKAMEGLLLDIYGLVDLDRAWDAITKLVQGSEEQIADIHPEPFETTCKL